MKLRFFIPIIMLFGIGLASDSIIFSLGINQTKATCPDCYPDSYHLNPVRGFNFGASKTINSFIPLIIGFEYSRKTTATEYNRKKYNNLHASALYPYSLNLSSSKEIKVLAGIDFSLLFLTGWAYTSDFQIFSDDWEFFPWDFEVPVDCGLLFGVDYKISNKSSISADYKFGLLNQLYSDYYNYEKFNQSFRINYNFHIDLDKKSSDSGSDIIIY